jgi:hypothetical protein
VISTHLDRPIEAEALDAMLIGCHLGVRNPSGHTRVDCDVGRGCRNKFNSLLVTDRRSTVAFAARGGVGPRRHPDLQHQMA